jgi:DNA-binding transcriptional regulator YiaG
MKPTYIEIYVGRQKMNTPNKQRFKTKGIREDRYAPLKGMLTIAPKELRIQLGLTQGDFWAPVGVSQSGGSRYETSRNLPPAISALLHLVHLEGLDLKEIRGDDCRAGSLLREKDPTAYAALLKEDR